MTIALLTWIAAAALLLAVFAVAGATIRARRRNEQNDQREGVTWKRAHHLASELLAGRNTERHTASVIDLLDTADRPLLAASALAVAVRQADHDVDEALFRAVGRSTLPSVLRTQISSQDVNTKIEALELVEVLRVHLLLGDAAVLADHEHPGVARAACDAVVELEPSVGIGLLVGKSERGDSWVLDALGRATDACARREQRPVPLSRAQWRDAPVLAQRALTESATFDQATVSDAVMALVESLEAASAAKRLAAVTALAACIEHPAAQIALAGALGSSDRMVRFATAANLSDSPAGRDILRRSAAEADGSDAARIASQVLWTADDPDVADAVAPIRAVAS